MSATNRLRFGILGVVHDGSVVTSSRKQFAHESCAFRMVVDHQNARRATRDQRISCGPVGVGERCQRGTSFRMRTQKRTFFSAFYRTSRIVMDFLVFATMGKRGEPIPS